jgi:hypothetical protein
MLFIDAHQYLDLYRLKDGQKLLGPLQKQQDHLFVTAQIADEVCRRKVEVAAEFLSMHFKKVEGRSFDVPGHLFGTKARSAMVEKLKALKERADEINNELEGLAIDLLYQISRSEDEVSKALDALFARAVRATEDEMKRARARKETGQPPGKKGDPLGDQVSWEQVLSYCKGKQRIWIISRDGDYVTEHGRKAFLNASLHRDLLSLGKIEVFAFSKLAEGMTHFVETTGAKADMLDRLTPEESTEINKEQDALPPLDWLSLTSGDAATAIAIRNRYRQLRQASWLATVSGGPLGGGPLGGGPLGGGPFGG